MTFFPGEGYEIAKTRFVIGKRLKHGESSKTGLYAIITENKGLTLRISLHKNVAEYFTECDSRYLAECWLAGELEPI